jgi:hypothetical protein
LISSGSYTHPWIGIAGTDVTPEIAHALGLEEARGFLVTDVTANSPADKSGIRGGYKITSINGNQFPLGGDVVLAIDNKTIRKIDDCPLHPVFRYPWKGYLSKYQILSKWDCHFHRFADLQLFQMHTTLAASSSCYENILAFVVDTQ